MRLKVIYCIRNCALRESIITFLLIVFPFAQFSKAFPLSAFSWIKGVFWILSLLISIKSHKKKSYCLCSTQIQSQIQHTWEEPQSADSQNIARNIYSVQSFARATINPIVNPAQRICWYNTTKSRTSPEIK